MKSVLFTIIVPVLGMLAIAGISFGGFRYAVGSHQEVVNEHAIQLIYVERLRSAFEWKVASNRGFFLTRDDIFLEREQAARKEFTDVLGLLKENYRNADRKVIEDIANAEAEHQKIADEVADIRKSGDLERTTAAFEKRLWPKREALRLAIVALERQETADFAVARESATVATQRAQSYALAAIIAAIALALYFITVPAHRLFRSYQKESRLRREAETALAGRTEFLSIVSHELRTPIFSLKLQLETLRRVVQRGVPTEEQYSIIARSERQIDNLTKLINSLLDLARLEHKQFELHCETLDLAVLARDSVRRMGLQCVVDSPESVIIHADPQRIEQAVTNLLSNALKYAGQQPISVSVRSDAEWTSLTVMDRGPGIAAEDQEAIFHRFERIRGGERRVPGLGLGLYVARHIAEAHGGTLTVESALGKGAAFTIRLPNEGVR